MFNPYHVPCVSGSTTPPVANSPLVCPVHGLVWPLQRAVQGHREHGCSFGTCPYTHVSGRRLRLIWGIQARCRQYPGPVAQQAAGRRPAASSKARAACFSDALALSASLISAVRWKSLVQRAHNWWANEFGAADAALLPPRASGHTRERTGRFFAQQTRDRAHQVSSARACLPRRPLLGLLGRPRMSKGQRRRRSQSVASTPAQDPPWPPPPTPRMSGRHRTPR